MIILILKIFKNFYLLISNSNEQIIILKDSRILSYNYPRYKKGII